MNFGAPFGDFCPFCGEEHKGRCRDAWAGMVVVACVVVAVASFLLALLVYGVRSTT